MSAATIPIVVMFGGSSLRAATPTRSRLVGVALLALRQENRVPATR